MILFSKINVTFLFQSGNDTAPQKSPEHAVKVQFAREFADVKTATPSVTESLSSASSFQSLSSTLSSKSSSGISADSALGSPAKCADTSYINSEIPGLDDLIAACADIKITEQGEQVDLQICIGDLSQDQTFTSAVDDLSIVQEDLEEELKAEGESVLNGTFEIDSSPPIPLQNPLPKIEVISALDSNSIVPYVSFEDSVLKSHALHLINKDSLVFSTALEFMPIEELTSKSTNEEKSTADTNDPQNESILQTDSSNVESYFNASIESQKNDTAGLISVNEGIDAPLARTRSPTIPLLSNISNVSGILEKDNSIDDVKVVSPIPEPASSEETPQRPILDYTFPIVLEKNHTEGNSNLSNQEPEIKSEIIPPVSPQIPKEDSKKVPEEIPVLQVSAVDSTFAIIPEKIEPQVSKEVVKNTGEDILKDTNQNSKKRARSVSPLRSPIPQSILDKVAQQQKALDATFELDSEEIQAEVKRPCSRASDYEEELEFNLILSTTEDDSKTQIVVTNAEEILSTGQILKEQGITITPSPEVRSLQIPKQRILDSTANISVEACRQAVPEITVSSPEKSSEESTLKNNNTQSNTLNSTLKKEIEEASPVKVLKNDFQSEISHTEVSKIFVEQDKVNEVTKDIKSIDKSEVLAIIEEASAPLELNSTVILEDSEIDLDESNATAKRLDLALETDYDTFTPQKQSTKLSFGDPSILDKVELEAQAIAKEIYDKSLEFADQEQFVSATSECKLQI